jgi:L-serine dehydratase
MDTIKKIFKIGRGPSSSHTMGPYTGAEQFKKEFPEAAAYQVTLYGSLALTGKGHLTDVALVKAFSPAACEIIWRPDKSLPHHPNALEFKALDAKKNTLGETIIYSIGGGDIVYENDLQNNITNNSQNNLYGMTELAEIQNWAVNTGKSYWEYVEEVEESDLWDYLNEVWKVMKDAVQRGLDTEGVIPGGLGLPRKANSYYTKGLGYKESLRSEAWLFSYALAVSEENACGGLIVTAPTCGSCGVLPAVLYHLQNRQNFTDKKILRALATAGLIGNIVKYNASISGAEAGCQAEIGTACSMASAAANQLFGGSAAQIEYAAEMGMEHHLGMTCDPVNGFVQIPCIERCSFAAARALSCNMYSMLSDGKHRVHFDKVVQTMKQTGKDIPSLYRETSLGGLAKFY